MPLDITDLVESHIVHFDHEHFDRDRQTSDNSSIRKDNEKSREDVVELSIIPIGSDREKRMREKEREVQSQNCQKLGKINEDPVSFNLS
ncbi:hypothetical protein WR25_25388 [Diploscapter pachys]|uniref:Uncharacterized protein n=1 Tax=Diploscapter pachys TaxID=2018661 RepID=A0A2A2JRW2_9BILA|nr:hypothetical protein WR25_25388 [Diploscapter pachys]